MEKLNGIQISLFFLVWCGALFYVASIGAAQGNWLFAGWCTFIFGLAVSASISAEVRTRAIRNFARTQNLVYAGDDLPRGLMISITSFDSRSCSIGNCVWGDLRGIPLAFFDLSYRIAKGSKSQTIVAFPRTGPHAVPEPPIDAVSSYHFEAAGDWIIAWIPGRVVKVEELEDWCVELHTLTRDLLAEARGGSEARPRLFRWMT